MDRQTKRDFPDWQPDPQAFRLRKLAAALHEAAPGAWVRTDGAVTAILETRPTADPQPHGGIWWRTHHLVRHLGGAR